jgi:pimeloyl-ACP methyl ester carboxylesterase
MILITLFAAAAADAALPFEPYTLRTFDGQPHDAQIGRLAVGPTIELAVIRLPSTAASPGSPIVFLSPGPGIASSILGRVPVYFALFDRLRATADVVLLDARGEGMSKPNLDECPPGPMPAQPFESESSLVAAYAKSVKDCAGHWRARGIDLGAFTTDARADDIEALRRALGAERVSVVAFSYGTEVALNLLRRYPHSVDRAVLAATGSGTGDHPIRPSILDAQIYKLGAVAGTDLRASISRLLAGLEKHPRVITVETAKGESHTFRVGKAGFQMLLAAKVADAGGAAMTPALVDSVNQGDDSILRLLVQRLAPAFRTGMTLVGRAIDCSTPIPDENRRIAAAEAQTALLGNGRNLHLDPRVCAAVMGNRARTKVETPQPLRSTVPVLFISGTLDANAPPFFAEQIAWGLPNSRHLIVTNGFHETLPSAEVQKVVADFIAGEETGSRSITFAAPKFLSIDEARAAAARSR